MLLLFESLKTDIFNIPRYDKTPKYAARGEGKTAGGEHSLSLKKNMIADGKREVQ